MIVTSTELPRGASERIEQHKYLLGKIDNEDLEQCIAAVEL